MSLSSFLCLPVINQIPSTTFLDTPCRLLLSQYSIVLLFVTYATTNDATILNTNLIISPPKLNSSIISSILYINQVFSLLNLVFIQSSIKERFFFTTPLGILTAFNVHVFNSIPQFLLFTSQSIIINRCFLLAKKICMKL